MNERGLKLFIRGYIYIYTTCSILFEKGMKPLGIGSSEAEVYYLVCKSVYIIQHRAKHRAILKSLFIKKNAKNFPREGKDHWTPIFIPFFPILPDPSFRSTRKKKFNAIEYTFRTDWLLEEGNMAVPVERDAVAPSARRQNSVANKDLLCTNVSNASILERRFFLVERDLVRR